MEKTLWIVKKVTRKRVGVYGLSLESERSPGGIVKYTYTFDELDPLMIQANVSTPEELANASVWLDFS